MTDQTTEIEQLKRDLEAARAAVIEFCEEAIRTGRYNPQEMELGKRALAAWAKVETALPKSGS
jgi:hypothetical protein